MITPRTTRLVRVPDLQAFRQAVGDLACGGTPLDTRHVLVVVPTRAAAAYLVRSIERRLLRDESALVLPDFILRGELHTRLAERLPQPPWRFTEAEREVLIGVACRSAIDEGFEPPFRLRPGLIAEILRFYDALQRNLKDVDTFERLALGMLEPGAVDDRGAERLVRQTRFLVKTFRHFERVCDAVGGADEHSLRRRLIAEQVTSGPSGLNEYHSQQASERDLPGATTRGPRRARLRGGVRAARPVVIREGHTTSPWRHVVLAVGDRASDRHGLFPADWDLLARVPGLERLDIVATDAMVAGAFHERIHQALPGIEEVRVAMNDRQPPVLLVPPGEALMHTARDREEEVAGFARWVRREMRLPRQGRADAAGHAIGALDGMALVVRQPLPYVYVAREVLRSAGIPSQMFDALPLASEPHCAALDLVLSFVSGNFARAPAIALLQSPHFHFHGGVTLLSPHDIAAMDRALSDASYLGDIDTLERLTSAWRGAKPGGSPSEPALRAADALLAVAHELRPLLTEAPCAEHLDVLLAFLTRHEHLPAPDEAQRARLLRGRAAMLDVLTGLRDACARFDPRPVNFDAVAALVRRWIEGHTFAPRTGEAGVHLVDADSARFGDFEAVQLAGLVDGEWPDGPRRNVFYPPALLRELGWPAESERLEGIRAAFGDLLRLPSSRLVVSTFTLEDEGIVTSSTLGDALAASGLETVRWADPPARMFEYEALGFDPVDTRPLVRSARRAVERRVAASEAERRHRGMTSGHPLPAYSLTALERYQDCPFKCFAADILGLEEPPEDEPALSPRARGRFVHEVFQRFFEAWDARGDRTITVDRVDEARTLFEEVAAPLLARFPEAEAVLERARLFGSAVAIGVVDVVLGLEASRPAHVRERWLEYRLDGLFALGSPDGRRVPLKGVADRIDLLEGHRIRVIDYKSGYPPNPKRALQVPIYALCAQERLAERDGRPWSIDEAAYVAFSGKRALVRVVRSGARDADQVLDGARGRLLAVVDGIGRGEFPPRPDDLRICTYCAYPSVCRKDYVGDE